jgi:cation-transporting ATPase 13A1
MALSYLYRDCVAVFFFRVCVCCSPLTIVVRIVCTEPFRVPFAGKLTDALFDKTGTLTTDQLQVVGVASCGIDNDLPSTRVNNNNNNDDNNNNNNNNNDNNSAQWQSETDAAPLAAPEVARVRARVVLAACHSLVAVADALVGDPTEMAAMRATGWHYDASSHTATPSAPSSANSSSSSSATTTTTTTTTTATTTTTTAAKSSAQVVQSHPPSDDARRVNDDAKAVRSVRALHNYRFASRLQRMSVIADVELAPIGASSAGKRELWVLAKGSPEKLGRLCSGLPPGYEATYRSMTENGHRVLALAYRRLDAAAHDTKAIRDAAPPREQIERDLTFLGFVAMSCLVRKDSAHAIGMLRGGALSVAMVTGDATLTALYVARQVGIADAQRPALLLTCDADSDNNDTALESPESSSSSSSSSSKSSKSSKSRPPRWEPALRSQVTTHLCVHCRKMQSYFSVSVR